MRIKTNLEYIELAPGRWAKKPQLVDAGDNRRRRDKKRTFTLDFLEEDGTGALVKNKEITKTLTLAVWGDHNNDDFNSYSPGLYTDGETETIDDGEGGTMEVLVEKDLLTYILGGGDPWNDEGVEILTLGEPDYVTVQQFFITQDDELIINPTLPPGLKKLCTEYLLTKIRVYGRTLKTLNFYIE